jgi:hypothetical protein
VLGVAVVAAGVEQKMPYPAAAVEAQVAGEGQEPTYSLLLAFFHLKLP